MKHVIDGENAAYLAIAELHDHPFFKESVWHIGYWGISSKLKDKEVRQNIKNDWFHFLDQKNKGRMITGNIDYFNVSALKMCEEYGMEKQCIRLDPRS